MKLIKADSIVRILSKGDKSLTELGACVRALSEVIIETVNFIVSRENFKICRFV